LTRYPLVYEINTRCWLRELSERCGRTVTLASVPESEFEDWRTLGFTHLWLLGVWQTGPRSRDRSLSIPELRRTFDETLRGWTPADAGGSPFAIEDYRAAPELGGEAGLKKFRSRLNARGAGLVLDFIPNHVGLDHPWVTSRSRLFVQAAAGSPESEEIRTGSGPRWLAHGKDPNFPPWVDTLQLDYRLPETHAAMIDALKSIADRCDGVRCDMAMLLLRDIFSRDWDRFPCAGAATDREFWADAIQIVRRSRSDLLILAEVYWDLEARLQAQGFDYTYDKRLYDYLVYRNHAEVHRHLMSVTPEFLRRSAHFLENHDEPRIASILSLAEQRPATLLALGLPGLRLLHEGQLAGARIRVPVQLSRRPPEIPQPEIGDFHRRVLTTLASTAVGRGSGSLVESRPAWAENPSFRNVVAIEWTVESGGVDVVVVNLAPHRSQALAALSAPDLAGRTWRVTDRLGTDKFEKPGNDLRDPGLYLDLPPHAAQLLHFEPVR
jgi:hypothetical protein